MSYRMKKKPASMRVKKQKEEAVLRNCSECTRPEWNEENRNFKGEIFIGYCPFGRFGYNRGKKLFVTYASSNACSEFTEKGGAE